MTKLEWKCKYAEARLYAQVLNRSPHKYIPSSDSEISCLVPLVLGRNYSLDDWRWIHKFNQIKNKSIICADINF